MIDSIQLWIEKQNIGIYWNDKKMKSQEYLSHFHDHEK